MSELDNLQNKYIDERFKMIEKLFIEKMERLHDLQEKTLEQAKKTNGRVNKLEDETEVIRFAAKRKWVIMILVLLAYGITIKEFRDLAIQLIF